MRDFHSNFIADQIRSASRNADVPGRRSDSTALICPYCDHAIATSEIFDESADREDVVEVNCYNCKLMFHGSQVITYHNVSKAAMTPEEAIAEVLLRRGPTVGAPS